MQLDQNSVRAGYAAGRRSVMAEAEALRAEMQEHVEVLRRDLAAVHRKLAEAVEEARLLRAWREAHVAHERSKCEFAAAYRRLLLERAWRVESDPATMTLQ